jgi:mono/diheme cytochrome c family protein
MALLFVASGIYNIAATQQHSALVYWLLETAKVRSIKARSADIVVPDLTDPAVVARGFQLFRENCVQCHGAPGVAPEDFARGLLPLAPPLVQIAREWTPAEIYWATRHGIKMTAMPAWEFRLQDADIWATVAFVGTLPTIAPVDYRRMVEAPATPTATAPREVGPGVPPKDLNAVERGKIALQQYACVSCHKITGIVGPDAQVGPPLEDLSQRRYIGAGLLNTPENMVRWISDPQQVDPLTAMPDMGVSASDARDIAAYLYTLR